MDSSAKSARVERISRRLAIFSIVAAVLHFVGEIWVHIRFGQFLPMLIVDYIAISLLLFAGADTRLWRRSALRCVGLHLLPQHPRTLLESGAVVAR